VHACTRVRFVALGFVALSALALLAEPAAATDKVIRGDSSGFVDDAEVCGLTVDISYTTTFRATVHEWVIGPDDPPADNVWLGNINEHGSATLTNVANGKSVLRTWNDNIKEDSLVDVGDGNWEYTYAVNGFPSRLGGRPIGVGRIVITQTLHLGDLADESDDYFVGEVASFDAGRHPDFSSDASFCDALIAAIG